jgi:hypothetical protein
MTLWKRTRRWAWPAAAILALGGQTRAEPDGNKANCECLPPVILPYHPARPATPWPIDPSRPVEPKSTDPKVDPKNLVEPKKEPVEPKVDQLARAPEAGTQAAESFNPNMFGDVFGSRNFALSYTTFTNRSLAFVLSNAGGPIPYRPALGPALVGGGVTELGPVTPSTAVISDGGRSVSLAAPTVQAVRPFTGVPGRIPLRESPGVTAAVQALNAGRQVLFVPSGTQARLQDSELRTYFVNESYLIRSTQTTSAVIVVPAGGGVVGLTKIAEDNSPIPRDRLIFNADVFNNATLVADGYDVTRYSPGFEFTFADGWASLEARFPFASTLAGTQTSGDPSLRATEFGDIHLTLKALAVRGQEFNLAGGVGVALPTGPDGLLLGAFGQRLLEVKNDSLIVTPYVAGLYTPGDRFFAQAWLQVGFDATGSPATFFPTGSSAVGLGRLRDQTLLSTDVQVGYWVVRNPAGSMLRGFAPFAEVHYNTPLNNVDSLAAPGLTFQSTNNRYDEVNLTVGFSALLVDRLLLSAGFVAPLRGQNDRSFDYQAGLRLSYYFGAGGPPTMAPAAGDAPLVRPPAGAP